MSASIPHSRNCSATIKRKYYSDDDRAREQIGVGNARKHLLEGRSPADGGTNCFGMLLRETGHSRVPAPPHMITGMI